MYGLILFVDGKFHSYDVHPIQDDVLIHMLSNQYYKDFIDENIQALKGSNYLLDVLNAFHKYLGVEVVTSVQLGQLTQIIVKPINK